jgi:hypothetical protein
LNAVGLFSESRRLYQYNCDYNNYCSKGFHN